MRGKDSAEIVEAIAYVREAADPTTARRRYEERYFPLALAGMRTDAEPADVLIATVGRRPYSVALSLTRTPAPIVYLIHTDESLASAERARLLAGCNAEGGRGRSAAPIPPACTGLCGRRSPRTPAAG